ncbi:MAG: hypothetical protein M3O03_10425 [Pseudomonadota bacterium]|nr:hypothetical protein [Pseudomonadota bacterium]
MAAKISSPIRITQKLKLIWLAFADPDAFEQAEKLENVSLASRENAEVRRVYIVRQAYIGSLIFMSSAVFVGWIFAALVRFICPQSKILATALAVSGTSLLLWTTVAV